VDRELQVQRSILYASAHTLLNTYSIKHRYDSRSMRGFAGSFSDDLKKELESSDTVKYVGTFSSFSSCCRAPADHRIAEADGEVKTQ